MEGHRFARGLVGPEMVLKPLGCRGEFRALAPVIQGSSEALGGPDCLPHQHLPRPSCSVFPQDSLLFLLKSLPLGCYFNIYCYGESSVGIYP